jgi:hypothetical protein
MSLLYHCIKRKNKNEKTANVTTCPLWTSWPPLLVVAEV